METITLNNGVVMSKLGLGVYQIPPNDTEWVVSDALELGYRLIDTAAFYNNERGVGNAIRKSGLPRDQIFVTTKLFPTTFLRIEQAFEQSLERLGLEYVDLYLIHWPFFRKQSVWKALEHIYATGQVRAIGVSNYRIKDLETISKSAKVVPAINQVEFHPFLYRKQLLTYCQTKGIALEAHTPLTHGKRLNDPRIVAMAGRYGKSTAQILIRWSLQHELIVIPKTTKKERLKENIDVFNFELASDDMSTLDHCNENDHIAGLSRIVGE